MENNFWQDKEILITGVCGTVGRELLRQVVAQAPARLVGLDNNESELFFLMEEYRDRRDTGQLWGNWKTQ